MFPNFIPIAANNLTESASINLVEKMELANITTPLTSQPIKSTYVHQGSGGTPILLLHGFDSSLLEFRRLLPLLAAKNETWAVDLLGMGFTERIPDLPISPAIIKIHLYYFWKTLIQQPVILVGASMGGAAAIDFALTYPDVVEKLVLLDSAGLTNQPLSGKFMFPPMDYLATAFLRNPRVRQSISKAAYYNKNFANADAQICAALHLECPGWSQSLIAFTKSGGYGSFAAQLHQLKQQTLIIWGENDNILGTKDAGKFAEAITNSSLVWIKNCGHVPHLEQPQITAEHILTFESPQFRTYALPPY